MCAFAVLFLFTSVAAFSVNELGAACSVCGQVAEGGIRLAETYSNTSGLFEAERKWSGTLLDKRALWFSERQVSLLLLCPMVGVRSVVPSF